MFADDRHTRTIFVLAVVLALSLYPACKKSPTVPQIPDTSRPVIWLNSFELSFTATLTGGNPATQTIEIKNAGPGTLDYTVEADADWIGISPASGSSTGQVNEHVISVNKTDLKTEEANHEAALIIKSSQAYNNPQQVKVSFNITKGTPPKIWVETQNFTFNAQEGGSNPSSQNLRIKNDGAGTLNYELMPDASWISVNPRTGFSQDEVKTHQIQVDAANLPSGTHTGKISVQDSHAANNPQTIQVTLNINETAPPKIWLSTGTLSFTAIQGGADPPAKSFLVRNSGSGVLRYSVDCDATWLSVNPGSGESGGAERSHSVYVNTGGLSAGTYQDEIVVSDAHASNTPQRINVSLTVTTPPTDNSISVSCNPGSAPTNTVVSFPISIKGNLNEISVFGLDLTFDPSIFEFHSISKGTLTGAWIGVDGNEISPGTLKIGGFAGSANPIPVASIGSIVIVKLKVISTASQNTQTKVWIQNYIDDIQGLTPSSTSTTFTYLR